MRRKVLGCSNVYYRHRFFYICTVPPLKAVMKIMTANEEEGEYNKTEHYGYQLNLTVLRRI